MKQQRVSKRIKLCLLLTRDILAFLIIAELLIILMSAICYGLDIPAVRTSGICSPTYPGRIQLKWVCTT